MAQLKGAGVRAVHDIAMCTKESYLFPSHRRLAGRHPIRRDRRVEMIDDVRERLAAVREKIARVRNPDDVVIVAVTKGFGPDTCRAALAAGLHVLGENRVHEAILKMDEVPGAEWHLIGHLQTNKVRQAAGRFALIHSIDSVRLATEIARVDARAGGPARDKCRARAAEARRRSRPGAQEMIKEIASLLDLRGLMAMGPSQGDPAAGLQGAEAACATRPSSDSARACRYYRWA